MTRTHFGPPTDHAQDLWDTFIASPGLYIGVDTETVSINNITLLGIGVSADGEEGFYITADDPELYQIGNILKDPGIHKIYHNAPFDLRVMRDYAPSVVNVDDTALMARLYAEPSAVLEDISFWVGHQTESMKRVFESCGVKQVIDLPFEVLATKCCRDAIATRALYDYYSTRIDMEYYEWLRPMIGTLNRISRQGIRLDQDRLKVLDVHYSRQIMLHRQVCQSQGFNPASPQQVGYFLGSRGNFLPLTRKGTQLITDDEHLIKLQDPMAHVVLGYRHASKMESTYIRPFLGQDRAYTTLRMDAGTGRVNSTSAGKDQPDRNLQNIPKQAERGDTASVRGAFIPDNGMFTKMDQSQAELRGLAELSQDKEMLSVFSRDEDIHGRVVQATGLTRTLAKNLNFGIMYGGDVQTIANFLHMADTAAVQTLLDLYIDIFPQAWQWLLDQEEYGMTHGVVYTRKGRPLRLPVEQGEKHLRNCSRNYPIQGTAFEAMADVMLDEEIQQYLNITRLQIHDELIFDGNIHIEGMEYNAAKSAKERCPTYDVKGRLAWLSGFYLPLEVQQVERWG